MLSPYRSILKTETSHEESSHPGNLKLKFSWLPITARNILSNRLNPFSSSLCPIGKLSISDDCSSDGTLGILQRMANHDTRINIVSQGVKYGSPQANFTFLMSQASGQYVFLADQDDIWHTNKLELFMQRMHNAEARYGKNAPILAFSDLVV